ncbi:MAG TPA: MBL fold metallo-hydrolase [Desulfobulbaceae bacterium]|jgi:7,8-dihydropterin-6-yl-methyl-4-(beta-D-ribofuranosyl)aminobenzene 5'-phosphate synthase|nr:MBL fold metallo-hydrolase [Desulfobulbaceae bacterium]
MTAKSKEKAPSKQDWVTAITILVDNDAGPGLVAEHGLSLWIETAGQSILFDTGKGTALKANARKLGVDLGTTRRLVLSHGHYDHTGAMAELLNIAGKVDIYCHPGVIQPRYARRNGQSRSIQMPRKSMAALDRLPESRLHWLQRPMLLTEHLGLTGPIPRETDYEDPGGPFYLDPDGKRADRIDDDLALWIQTGKGLVVCVGCCHAGLVNTLRHIRRLTNGARIRSIIGGLHLAEANQDRLEQTINELQTLKPDSIIPCHCTGKQVVAVLRNALGECVTPGVSGMTLRFTAQ